MENLEIINTFILIGLTIAFFIQNNQLKIIKTITDTYQPEKLKQAQEYIDKGNEHKMKLLVSEQLDGVSKKSMERFMEANKTFHEQFDELISMPIVILKEKDWIERENFLKTLPKNADQLRRLLKAYDSGELDEFSRKQK